MNESFEAKTTNREEALKNKISNAIEACKMNLEFLQYGDDGLECTITSKMDPSLAKEEKEKLNKMFQETALNLNKILTSELSDLRFSNATFLTFHGEGQTVNLVRPALRFVMTYDPNKGETKKELIKKINELVNGYGLKEHN